MTTEQPDDNGVERTIAAIMRLWSDLPAHRIAELTGLPVETVEHTLRQLPPKKRRRRKPVAARTHQR